MSQTRQFGPPMYQQSQGMHMNGPGGMPQMYGQSSYQMQNSGIIGHASVSHPSHGIQQIHGQSNISSNVSQPIREKTQNPNTQSQNQSQIPQNSQNTPSNISSSNISHKPSQSSDIQMGDISSTIHSKVQKDTPIYLRGHKSDVFHAIFLKNNKLVSGGKDKTVKIWDYLSAAKSHPSSGGTSFCLRTLDGHTDAITRLASHPLHHDIFCSASRDKTARLWDLRGRDSNSLIFTTNESNVDIRCNPRGNEFAVLTKQNSIFVFDERKENEPLFTKQFQREVSLFDMEYGMNGEHLFITRSNHVIVLDMNIKEEISTIPITCDPSKTYCLKFDPAYKYLAVASTDSIVSILSTKDWICQYGISHIHDAVLSVAFSHDSKWIAHAGKQRIVDITNVETGEQVRTVSCPESVTSINFSPDEYFLSISNNGSTIWLYDMRKFPELM